MAIAPYLAMTAGEFREHRNTSEKIGWLACHFSPYSRGLSNLPQTLPPGSLLIVDDMTPIHGHDPQLILQQLQQCLQEFSCAGILLDFQREGYREAEELARILSDGLACPVGVTPLYAGNLTGPVCLPPVPPSSSLASCLEPWQGREIWLELGLEGERIVLTEDGTQTLPCQPPSGEFFSDESLHCRYQICRRDSHMEFILWRTQEDWAALLEQNDASAVTAAVALWQEWIPDGYRLVTGASSL